MRFDLVDLRLFANIVDANGARGQLLLAYLLRVHDLSGCQHAATLRAVKCAINCLLIWDHIGGDVTPDCVNSERRKPVARLRTNVQVLS